MSNSIHPGDLAITVDAVDEQNNGIIVEVHQYIGNIETGFKFNSIMWLEQSDCFIVKSIGRKFTFKKFGDDTNLSVAIVERRKLKKISGLTGQQKLEIQKNLNLRTNSNSRYKYVLVVTR